MKQTLHLNCKRQKNDKSKVAQKLHEYFVHAPAHKLIKITSKAELQNVNL